MNCILCNNTTVQPYETVRSARFFNCTTCDAVFRDPAQFFDEKAEMKRYQKHTNDVMDRGYQASVKSIIDIVLKEQQPTARCLDFGAGESPIVSYLLALKNFNPDLWDPFFHPNVEVFDKVFDFITCSETIEHFYRPLNEFKLMASVLKNEGTLYCKTALRPTKSQFTDWYYKNDHTHVIFYNPATLTWIQKEVGFTSLEISEDLQIFRK